MNSAPKRICSKCGISNREIRFWFCKDTRSGKIYQNNICIPCKVALRAITRAKHYRKNRRHQIAAALAWNKAHRKQYNERRRVAAQQKRFKNLVAYCAEY